MLSEIIKSLITIENLETVGINGVNLVLNYLEKYGYIKRDGIVTQEELHNVLDLAKKFMGVTEEGIGPKTIKMMMAPRCGYPDIMPLAATTQKWNKKNLTFTINGWVGDGISSDDQISILQQAYDSWAAIADITIKYKKSGPADINIGVGKGRSANMDGQFGVLAWAYLPNGTDQPLDMVFDDDEKWAKSNSTESNIIYLLNVAAHEGGHTLGLGHSTVNNALMAPFYSPNVSKPVQNDDVKRIQNLYGPPKNNPSPPQPTPTPIPTPSPNPSKTTLVIDWDKKTLSADGFRISKIGN